MQLVGEGSYSSWTAITASDTALVNCRALYITGAGTVIVRQGGSTTDLTHTAGANTIFPIALEQGQVRAASGATGIYALS